MRNAKMILTGLILSLTIGTALAQNGSITVKVTNFKNNKGDCIYWLYNSANGFLKEEKAIKQVEASITANTSHYAFKNLPSGRYAVVAAHDENGNHKFDTNFIGFPKETYGNTQGTRGDIGGPPKFDKSSFVLSKADTVVTIKVE